MQVHSAWPARSYRLSNAFWLVEQASSLRRRPRRDAESVPVGGECAGV